MPSENSYRPEIDGLRAFAVIAVIINHFNKELLPGGYLGVDIFFVISGYVITSSLSGRRSKNFKDFISGFYERRIKRLVPALVVFIAIASIAISMFNPDPNLQLETGKRALFGFSNIALYNQSTDYFAESAELNIFTHTWSLGVEEQFYLMFPFVIWFSGFAKQSKKGVRNLFLALLGLSAISIVFFLYSYLNNPLAAYFLMPSRFWEMSAGCMLFIGIQKRLLIKKILEKVPLLCVIVLIVAVMYVPVKWGAACTVAIVGLTSVLIAGLNNNESVVFKILTRPKIIYIGLISYSLYLWHWGVLSISRWTMGIHLWSVPFQVALMLILAAASYRWIETPFRKGIWFGRRWKTLTVGVSSLFLVLLPIEATAQKQVKNFLFLSGNNIYPPKYDEVVRIAQKDLYCHMPDNADKAFADCLPDTQAKESSSSIYLLGDSHASNHHWSIQSAIASSVLPFDLYTLTELGFIIFLNGGRGCAGHERGCVSNAGDRYMSFFEKNLNEGDYIFISMSRDRYAVGQFEVSSSRASQPLKIQRLSERLKELEKIAAKKKAKIVLIGDTPKVCPDGINYLSEVAKNGKTELCITQRSISLEDRKDLNDSFLEIAEKSPHVLYVDPHDSLCQGEICSAVGKNNRLLYADTSPHFSTKSKDSLSDYWGKTLNMLLGKDSK